MHAEQVRFSSGMNIFLGLWLLFSPFILGYSYNRIATVEAVVFGVIIVGIAWLRLVHPIGTHWASAVNLLIGLALIGSAFLFGADGVQPVLYNNLTIGFPLVLFALWSLLAVVHSNEE